MSTAPLAASLFAWGVVGAYYSFTLGWLESKARGPHEMAKRVPAEAETAPDLGPAACRFAWTLQVDARSLAARLIALVARRALVLRRDGGIIEAAAGPEAPAAPADPSSALSTEAALDDRHGELVQVFTASDAARRLVPGSSAAPMQGIGRCRGLVWAEIGKAGRPEPNRRMWLGGVCLYLGFLAVLAVAFGPGGIGLWTAMMCAGGLGAATLLSIDGDETLRRRRFLASTLGPPLFAIVLAAAFGAWLWMAGAVLMTALGAFVFTMRRRLVAPHRDLPPVVRRVAAIRRWLARGPDEDGIGLEPPAAAAEVFHRHLGHAVALELVEEWAETCFGDHWRTAETPPILLRSEQPAPVTVDAVCGEIDMLINGLADCDRRARMVLSDVSFGAIARGMEIFARSDRLGG